MFAVVRMRFCGRAGCRVVCAALLRGSVDKNGNVTIIK